MGYGTRPTKTGGAKVDINTNEIVCSFEVDSDGKLMKFSAEIPDMVEQVEPEVKPTTPCKYRGEASQTVPCCGGKTRATIYYCNSKDTPSEMGAQMCNSKMCKFYNQKEVKNG